MINMNMHELLAQHYGTNGVTKTAAAAPPAGPSREDMEKEAAVALFNKLAADNGVDLSKLNDEQIAQLWNDTFSSKTAGELPPQFAAHMKGKDDKDDDDKKKDEDDAKKEHEEKKAFAEKFAEADYMGRTMAHAYVHELDKIAADRAEKAKTASVSATGKVEFPKVASAIDRLAMPRSLEIVQEFNKTAAPNEQYDEQKVAAAIAELHKKGLAETVKTASAQDWKAAVEIRALESLEAIGLPVTWGT